MPPRRSLELSEEEMRTLGNRALQLVLDHFSRTHSAAVYPPISPDQLHQLMSEPLPVEAQKAEDVFGHLTERVIPNCRNNHHPRMFGYVNATGDFMGALADFVASAINQNVTSWRSAPAATEIELLTVDWVKEVLGYPSDSAGVLLSGGSMANFAALSAALSAKAGTDIQEYGIRALEREPVVYASRMTHLSVPKAAQMLGLGRRSVRLIETREDFTMHVDALDAAIRRDLAAGRLPICVVANAGDVNTGAVDPLEDISRICSDHDLWLHVDASYGGFAVLSPSLRPLFDGLSRADSIALDPHKWLFVPFDAGCLLVRDPAALRRAFSREAEYIEVLGDRSFSTFAFWDYGPELSRRFRALKIWMSLKIHGVSAVGRAIEENVRLARMLGDRIDAAEDFERLAPVPLSIVCFRYLPGSLRRGLSAADLESRTETEVKLNDFNSALAVEIQRGGSAYVSNAVLDGRFALRACIVNYRTREEDVDDLLRHVRQTAARLESR